MAIENTRDMVRRYLQAERDVLDGKSTTFAGRVITMVDLPDIRKGRQEWERRLALEEAALRGRRPGYSLAEFT